MGTKEEETPIRSNAPKFSTFTLKKVRVTVRAKHLRAPA
jgi:hypothetical protein